MPRGAKKRPIKHGTPGGYQRHLDRGEEACAECKTGKAAYQAKWRQNTPDARALERKRAACAWRARKTLSELHKAEYLKLLRYEMEKEGLS